MIQFATRVAQGEIAWVDLVAELEKQPAPPKLQKSLLDLLYQFRELGEPRPGGRRRAAGQ